MFRFTPLTRLCYNIQDAVFTTFNLIDETCFEQPITLLLNVRTCTKRAEMGGRN